MHVVVRWLEIDAITPSGGDRALSWGGRPARARCADAGPGPLLLELRDDVEDHRIRAVADRVHHELEAGGGVEHRLPARPADGQEA
jgi:hypothetical protein